MGELDDNFALLLGHQPSDKEKQDSLPGARRAEAQGDGRRVAAC